ncbi:caspase domain-containing protein [Bradyrhizobium sp. Arg237L]|uniref:caspase family protein n=1 Tax=Bradyrhizobium sp. Arg237L TaxID=3003352 RepID=UPI00249F3C37|nr:caspase domain-containing protein [Bradyrhizobium sp. Arg237L]MDI4234604.1 caspase domain-containing protein [Bradyrhizobium sp. Arg237L]
MTRILLALFIGLVSSIALPAQAQEQEKRLALVIGNGAYATGALPTAANDAGLVAQTLQAAGFDVVGARDLDGETLRKSFREFVQKVQEAGPNTVAFVYLAGYGVQLTGENYFIPVDAKIARDIDVPVEGLRLSDYMRQLSALPVKANIIVLDGARANSFAKEGQPLAGGLALVEPDAKMLLAFNAAPGTIAPEGQPPYGPYAQALAEMIRAGGLPLPELFDRVRLRVSEMTKGAQIPWNAQKIDTPFMFFERQQDAPPTQVDASARDKPIRDFDAKDAYAAALERDTLQGYEDFLQAFPNDPLAKRVRAIVAARREAITWGRSYRTDSPNAYWSYLHRYPRGPHAADARRRLTILSAALEPPPSFAPIDYDVGPPPPDEFMYVEDRPVLYFDDPVFAFAPPPPPPVFFLPPPPPDFVVLAPPPPPVDVFVLPVPLFVPIPVFVRPPIYVAPPPNNIVFANIHNQTIINNVINNPNPTPAQLGALGTKFSGGAARPAIAPSLPPAAAQRANLVQPSPQGAAQPALGTKFAPSASPAPGAAPNAAGAHALPGAGRQPLPQTTTAPATAAQPDPGSKATRLTSPPTTVAPNAAGANAPAGTKGRPSPQTATAPATAAQPNATKPAASPSAAAAPADTKLNRAAPGQRPSAARPADVPRAAAAPPSRNAPAANALARPTPSVAPPAAAHRPSPPPAAARTPPPAVAARAPARAAVAPPPAPAPRVAAPPPRAAAPPPRVASPPPQMQRAAPPARPAPPAGRGGAACPPGGCPQH